MSVTRGTTFASDEVTPGNEVTTGPDGQGGVVDLGPRASDVAGGGTDRAAYHHIATTVAQVAVSSSAAEVTDAILAATPADPVAHHFTASNLPRVLSPIYSEASDEPPRSVPFHRDSDLFIRAKDENGNGVLLEVVSFSLAAVSNVFRTMVWGSEHLRPEHGAWIIELNDNAKALRILMRLIHYQFSSRDIPDKPTQDDLYHITTVAHKYELDNLLIPFAKDWNLCHHRHIVSNDKLCGKHEMIDRALWTCWKLADLRTFKTLVRQVALIATVQIDGTLLDASGTPWKDSQLPHQVLDLMADFRAKAVQTVLNGIREPVESLMMGDHGSNGRYCHGKEHREECNAMLLGSVIAGLIKKNIWPIPDSRTYQGSALGLIERVSDLGIKTFNIPGKRPHEQPHSSCGFGLKSLVSEVQDEEAELPLPDCVVKYMELRGKVLRTFDECAFAPYRSQAQVSKMTAEVEGMNIGLQLGEYESNSGQGKGTAVMDLEHGAAYLA
ncbi:hypothetical protein NKR23_g7186 [Pleurostoma richardsiae]|uniref:BTB domain-containing protein n=1 Tax=Pleurostoma richardsiae TaxID=41990 RepID=A0AA38RU31_9PEZI|nr:hypothetical protein NKR23_g7186 [Pleurostoma richardsiae]